MGFNRMHLFVLGTIILTPAVLSRAVNISNTWMLPEEDFPVFYRYFRDRISWYEADAVCQFHHANLVTADSTFQYDAIRAYLRELDITENIWIGLSRATDRQHFTWTNFQPLSGDGHWQQPIPKGNNAVCVAMDPVADYLWRPLSCGGPDVASFICELPVPSWAMGPKGCLFTELPSLTVLYVPEQLALELTSDCGLDGTKRVLCKGNANRDEILKQLTCGISPEDFITSPNTVSDISPDDVSLTGKTTKPWIWTSNTVDIDYGLPTRHRRETEDTVSPLSTRSTTDISSEAQNKSVTTFRKTTSGASSTSDENLYESTVSGRSERPTELQSRPVTDSTMYTDNGEETQEVTTDSKVTDLEVQDSEDFSSAIGQGQLFSIIENGTMFDIIEVNETASEDPKFPKEVIMETPESEAEMLRTSTDPDSNILYTTVVYHKEPPSQTSFVTNKSVKKADKHPIKQKKMKNPNPITPNVHNNYTNSSSNSVLSKEVEMFPITDSLIKLNRTFRKGLTMQSKSDAITDDDSRNGNHQHVEIKWHDKENKNVIQMQMVVTTKRLDSMNASNLESKEHKTSNINTTEKDSKLTTQESKHFLPKDEGNIDLVNVSSLSNEFLEEPQIQQRPNRQRQLTRPQRRSFYPYFFSRVLG